MLLDDIYLTKKPGFRVSRFSIYTPKPSIANWKDPPFLMGKSTISMAIFNSYVSHYQRVLQWQIGGCV